MSTFDDRLAYARECEVNIWGSDDRKEVGRVFDACAALAREVVAEKDAEIARLRAERLAESRTVTDAQRKRIAETLMHRVGVAVAYEYADDILAILEEQPAAESAP